MNTDQPQTIVVTLSDGDSGHDHVVLSLDNGQCVMQLTAAQARALATDIIMAVNRAEVRANLRVSQNLHRRELSQEQVLFKRHSFAK
jgi:hypothetical protein